MKNTTCLLLICLISFGVSAQRVGLVMSGGAASGIAHVGVLKALEENNIPIDYITGTSMGALVGSLYACGYSPAEIEAMFTSPDFYASANGEVPKKYLATLRPVEEDASLVTIKFDPDSNFRTPLPTNIVDPVGLDFNLVKLFHGAEAAADYQFDSLFVPYRCVASDITTKTVRVFKDGNLTKAVRASVSYPFYLRPITIEGKVYFDGGLYNNFPSDILQEEFSPDVIIGSNVSSNEDPPHEDDVISQIRNMVVSPTNFELPAEKGYLLQPVTPVSTFEFERAAEMIDSGYFYTLGHIDEIKALINREAKQEVVQAQRQVFNNSRPPFRLGATNIIGLNRQQSKYVRKIFRAKKDTLGLDKVEPRFFRLYGDDKIKSVYPWTVYNKQTGLYDLYLRTKPERSFIIDFGGNVSSRPINTGFVGVRYNYVNRYALTLFGNSYFGKLYGSVKAGAQVDFPSAVPVFFKGYYCLNRWNYFRSQAFFFEQDKPDYLVQNESFANLELGFPFKNKGRVLIGGSPFITLRDEYYQTPDFGPNDTADITTFKANSAYFQFERNSLNRKQYASEGSSFKAVARFTEGEERTVPGSTSASDRRFADLHSWVRLEMRYQNYYKRKGTFKLGFLLQGVFSTQEEFSNYTATILRASSFEPTPESKTLFLESFRSFSYAAAGHQFVISLLKNVDLRLEGYLFQPYLEVKPANQIGDDFISDEPFARRYTIATSNLVYHSPIGPASASVNYYFNNTQIAQQGDLPLTFLLHFGYTIFNRRAIR